MLSKYTDLEIEIERKKNGKSDRTKCDLGIVRNSQ